ncbi:MAG: Rne/Rng family ribonuclease [Deltaproteobacteria bacterium]|nr:Rne/Rng family ribonuclease [Deltaproteobacteria bacterium]MBW1918766.1 Rne/Rng family ribonuclease [Deltaproteobacteria bacterium]MBW1935926.1 Rne/Rng family ribonuclease [Deltaproteobacteria bacterium]MBW1976766.1 Rne/Rng family ribonuclease [Deltaproteobacteria bacterium]MBW2043629.1 Rne/Rng family ribonuclease [Deltaproteobacteria bacterium]
MKRETKMLINAVEPEEFRVAFVKEGLLDGFQIETSTAEQKVGNIYKGVVQKIEPRLQACFVNFGSDKNGFLAATDVHPEYYKERSKVVEGQGIPPIEKVLSKGQELLVQVTKEMPGRKGAQLTTYISLAGRFLVLTPGRSVRGISRKIEDEEERQRLKSILAKLKLPEEIGCIVRTMAAGQSKKDLSKDLSRLLRMWKRIRDQVAEAPPFSLIHKEQDICLRTLRDYYTDDVSEILVDDKETLSKIKEYMKVISPRDQRRVKLYKGNQPIFDYYNIEKQIETIYSNKVELKSGGSIVFDTTEALYSIDVNSGRGRTGSDVESMAFKTNMEAAKEIARQLRLRDIGGLIVIDFIDMKDRNHLRQVERALREELKKDRAKTDTSHISKFGLMELSRQRLRPSIESRSYQTCHFCNGRGLVMSVESAALSYLRRIWVGASKGDVRTVNGTLAADVADYLQNVKRKELAEIEERYGVSIVLQEDPSLPRTGGVIDFVREEEDAQ